MAERRNARRHGTNSCYCGGCRRDECRAAHRAYGKALQQRHRDRWRMGFIEALEAALAEGPLDEVEERGLRLALERHRRMLTTH